MATFTWNIYSNTPAWNTIGANTLVFSGSDTDLSEAVTVAAWQDGTHGGDGDPGSDTCGGANHSNNVKYISSTQFDSGGGTETLNDTNLTQDECTLRIDFTHGSAVVITNARLYAYDGTTVTTEATGVEVQAFEQGEGDTAWTEINDDSDNTGGDNTGERLDLTDSASETEHTWYVALSASPESVGGKTDFDFGVALTYS
jgi:hypothetical protein